MLSFIYKFHFILYKFIQSFSEIKRERDCEFERELERKTLREGRIAGESNEANEYHSLTQRQRRKWQSDELMTNLPSTMSMSIYDEGRPLRRRRWWARCGDDDGDVTVRGLLGLVLVCVLGIFFFFFDKHLCALCLVCWVLCLVCFCIGVWSLCQWRRDVMGFCQASVTWWDFARRQRRDGFNFSFSVFFFFFFTENLWACRERATCNGLAVVLVLLFFI